MDVFCNEDNPYVWCLPNDYKMDKHPFLFSHLVRNKMFLLLL